MVNGTTTGDLDPTLAETGRLVRAEYQDAREIEEEAAEQLAAKEADLVDVVLDAMARGQRVRLRMGPLVFEGAVVHVADDLAVIDDDGGAQLDIPLSGLDELWLSEPVPAMGRGRRSAVPACFDDCLEGLEASGREVELVGPALAPTLGRIEVEAARDHLVLGGRAARHVIARRAVAVVIRRP